jgi:hypothetical protein
MLLWLTDTVSYNNRQPSVLYEPWWQGYTTNRAAGRPSFMQTVERVSGVRLNRR